MVGKAKIIFKILENDTKKILYKTSTPRFLAHTQPQVTHYFHHFFLQDYWLRENTIILPLAPYSKFIFF